MWIFLKQMYETKKIGIRVYRFMKDIYDFHQGKRPVRDFYRALRAKWEDLDYYCRDDSYTATRH